MNKSILVRAWRLLSGTLQWRALWLFHSKFIIGVSAVVVDDSGRILLLRHKFWRQGTWGLPSGYSIAGELLESTVQRELKEETGLDARVSHLLRLKSGFRLRLEVTYVARLTGGQLKLDESEVLEAQFFTLGELPDGLLSSHKDLLEVYRAGAKGQFP